jgi:hypothetical protein
VLDRTTTIRASLFDVGAPSDLDRPRDPRGLRVPSEYPGDDRARVVVPVSLVGTLGVMYLLRFSLDNLSLMALTVATGFVVDDAIVVPRTSRAVARPAWDRSRRRWSAPARSASRCSRSASR